MKFNKFLQELESLSTSGKVKDQTVEVVANMKKYSIAKIDLKSDAVSFDVTRNFYHPLTVKELMTQMKDYKNMVNDEADCRLIIEGKASEPVNITELFLSNWNLELVV